MIRVREWSSAGGGLGEISAEFERVMFEVSGKIMPQNFAFGLRSRSGTKEYLILVGLFQRRKHQPELNFHKRLHAECHSEKKKSGKGPLMHHRDNIPPPSQIE